MIPILLMRLLNTLETDKKEETEKIVITREKDIAKQELLEQKSRIEEKIRRLGKQDVNEKITTSLIKIHEINESLSDLQNSLNTVWKRTQQIEEELRFALSL